MIKKILSVVLVLCFAVLNTEAAFADIFADDYANKDFTEKQIAKMKRNGIVITDDLVIKREKVKLESFLNKKYRLFKYIVKNKTDKELFLHSNSLDSWQMYKNAQGAYKRERFPYSYGHMFRATGETIGLGALYASALVFPPMVLMFAIIDDAGGFDNIPTGWDIPKTYLLNPVRSTLLLPYDLYKNPKEIKKADGELGKIKSLVGDERYVPIKPGEKVEFYEIVPKSKGDYILLYSKPKNRDYEGEYYFNF